MKKFLIYIICFSMFCSCLPVFAENDSSTLLFYDFEKNKPFTTNEVSSYCKADEEHQTVLKIETNKTDSSGTARYAENMGINLSAKKIMWQFDVQIFQSNNDFTFMLYNADKKSIFKVKVDKSGTIYATNDGSTSKKINIVPGNWIHMQFLMDFENKTVQTAFDGVYMDEISMIAYDSESISDVYMGAWKQGNDAKVYIDNMRFDDCSELDSLKAVTNDGKEDVGIEFITDNLGNIFFNGDVQFSTQIYNKKDSPAELEVYTRVTSETGKLLIDEKKDVLLNAKSTENIDYSKKTDRFGFYDVYLSARDKQSGDVFYKKTQFSVVHAREDGRTNPIIGIADHIANKKSGLNVLDDKVNLMQKAGLSYYREEYNWDDYERSDGVYKHDALHKKIYESLADHNIKPLVLAAHTNRVVKNENPPVSPAAADRYGSYVANLSLDISDITNEFEIFNEFNLRDGVTPQDYVNMCKAAYEKTKAVNKDTVIYALSGAAIPSGSTLEKQREWVKQCFENGIADYADGFSIHPYEFSGMPETSPTFETVNYVYELMNEYNCQDKPLITTEFGWPATNVGEDNQAYYTIRYLAMAGKLQDLVCFYNFQCKESTSASENSFGWIRQSTQEGAGEYVPFSAKPIYLAVSNWNSLMLGAEQQEKINCSDSNDYLYRYKLQDGRDCIIAWNISGDKKYRAYKLGAEKADIFDIYGNTNTIYAHNGAINVEIGNAPIYIIGKFDDNINETNSIIVPEKNEISSSAYETEVLHIRADSRLDYEFDVPYNISVDEPITTENGMSVNVHFLEGQENEEKIIMYIKNKSGKLVSVNTIKVNCLNSVELELFPAYYRNGHWQIGVNVKNNKKTLPVSGTLELDEIPGIIKNKSFSFSNLRPKTTEYFRINVPEFYETVGTSVNLKVNVNENETITDNETIYFCGFRKAEEKPKIDGNLLPGEWDKSMPFSFASTEQVKEIKDYGGPNDLSGKAYCMYDEDNFYVAAEITDDIYCNKDDKNRLYACDSIQFAFAEERNVSALRTEYSIGNLNGESKAVRHAFMAVDTTINGVKDNQSYDDINVAVSRDEEKRTTYYEASIPWSQIYGDSATPFTSKYIYFSILVNDNDGEGRRGWMEFGSGIGSVKNPELFIKVPVVSKR